MLVNIGSGNGVLSNLPGANELSMNIGLIFANYIY